MKINIIKGKSSKQSNNVEEVVRKLFPTAEVSNRAKYTFTDLEGSYVLDAENYSLSLSRRAIAEKVLNALNIGVSEKTLESL